MNTSYLLLGSNLGDRKKYLTDALSYIDTEAGKVVQQSAVYETMPWGNTAVPDYLNQVVKIETLLSPHGLLSKVLEIEQMLGRKREGKWGARTIDIDILFYGEEAIHTPDLTIPHPFLQQRKFVLEPLAELCPNLVHPVLKKTILALKDEIMDNLVVKKL